MKSFKEFITEMPMPSGVDTSKFDIRDADSSRDYYDRLKEQMDTLLVGTEQAQELGDGSSRIAYRVPLKNRLLTKKMMDILGITNKAGNTQTVIKIAKNSMGALQNKMEVEMYKKASPESKQWLAPVFDTSDSMLKLKGGVEKGFSKGMAFIQMPLCTPVEAKPSSPEMKGREAPSLSNQGLMKFREMFGEFSDTDDNSARGYCYKLNDILNQVAGVINSGMDEEDIKERLRGVMNFTDEQFKNIVSFAKAFEELDLRDFHPGNLGIYKDRVVMLDFGFEMKFGPRYYQKRNRLYRSGIDDADIHDMLMQTKVSPETGKLGFKPTKRF